MNRKEWLYLLKVVNDMYCNVKLTCDPQKNYSKGFMLAINAIYDVLYLSTDPRSFKDNLNMQRALEKMLLGAPHNFLKDLTKTARKPRTIEYLKILAAAEVIERDKNDI